MIDSIPSWNSVLSSLVSKYYETKYTIIIGCIKTSLYMKHNEYKEIMILKHDQIMQWFV